MGMLGPRCAWDGSYNRSPVRQGPSEPRRAVKSHAKTLVQVGAALAPGVRKQAFKHVTGIRGAGIMSAHVTPMGKIPIDSTGFGD